MTVINEEQDIYLWVDVANAVRDVKVDKFIENRSATFDITGTPIGYKRQLVNGKNNLVTLRAADYKVTGTTALNWTFTVLDTYTVMPTTLHGLLTINNTINDPPPYYGLKFDFKFNRHDPETGDLRAAAFSYKGMEDFENGLIPDGTLLNTVKLTYTP